MNFNNVLLLTKIQPTLDVDPTPTGSNVAQIESLDWNYLEGDTLSRNRSKSYLGSDEELTVNPKTKFSYDVELSQIVAAGDVPAFGVMLRACGMAEVINAGVDVRYTPV